MTVTAAVQTAADAVLVLTPAHRGRDLLTLRLVEEFLEQQRSADTRRGYAGDLRSWCRWLADRGCTRWMPAGPT